MSLKEHRIYQFVANILQRMLTLQILKAKSYIISPLDKSPVRTLKWTYKEERALVEFISIGKSDPKYGLDNETEWPRFRDGHSFWKDAAMHIKTSTSANILLTSTI